MRGKCGCRDVMCGPGARRQSSVLFRKCGTAPFWAGTFAGTVWLPSETHRFEGVLERGEPTRGFWKTEAGNFFYSWGDEHDVGNKFETYTGELRRDAPMFGEGILTFADGEKFSGTFSNEETNFHHGTTTEADGCTNTGSFDHEFNFHGAIEWRSGDQRFSQVGLHEHGTKIGIHIFEDHVANQRWKKTYVDGVLAHTERILESGFLGGSGGELPTRKRRRSSALAL